MELMGILLPAILVVMFLFVPMLIRYLGRMRRAEGIVISSEARQVQDHSGASAFIPVITYRYRFNGAEYTGSTGTGMYGDPGVRRFDPWSTPVPYETAMAVIGRFTPGSRCAVFPDLSNHSRSTIRMASGTSASRNQALMVAIAAAITLLSGALVMFFSTSGKSK